MRINQGLKAIGPKGMLMNPIQQLLREHADIMAQVAELRSVGHDLTARGEVALPEALPVLRRVSHMMETQLALHARKEEEALFPAIEALIGRDGSPTDVMRLEHADIHAQGEALRALLAQAADVVALSTTADEIIALLDMHFTKEEQMLFPMIESLLDEATGAEVSAKMEPMP